MRASLLLALAWFACAHAPAACADTLDLAWWQAGALTARRINEDGSSRAQAFDGARLVPLGSLWKLFVYVHAVERKLPTPDYTCTGKAPHEEVYCCDKGGSIARDAALAQSCGLFFAPARLMLARRPWRDYWTERLGHAPSGETDWLADPARLTPERLVTLRSLLQALASVPAAGRVEAQAALLRVVLGARGVSTVGWFGARLRVKTFSWHEAKRPTERFGGAAGWLADGTPVWFGGAGTSNSVLQKWAPRLAAVLPASAPARDAGCVLVDYFARYPLKRVEAGGVAAVPGSLNGRYVVQFENGRSLALFSQGELALGRDAHGRAQVSGRFGVNEYVARVIDREGSAAEPQAARALAVAIRTYLQQNATWKDGCQRIADSSATQRVSPNPATAAARAVAQWTDQLVLAGVNVRYHSTTPGKDTMAWSAALEQARQGRRFDEILAAAYPRAELGTLGGVGALQCTRLAGAEAWLAREVPRWERALRREAGYETPPQLPAVCQLAAGMPFSEQSRNRIFVRGLVTREDRITLAHEFLHLGLRNHPRGQDETLVEQLARRLVDVNLDSRR
ncbi:DUF2300 domain-containing protein [Massilia sp. TSP1-1-2]|uniref:DUF2300 domain-containing protein n=1 Tax=Massilia sp. TSP1-1-2 TaxID=2804649 RepID=UPI003CEFFED3